MLTELLNLLLLPFSLLLRRMYGRRRAFPYEIKRFYKSPEWKRLRDAHLSRSPDCLACGRSAKDGARMNVDHIKPLYRHWHLRLAPGNLQTLCALCNHGKGGKTADHRGYRSCGMSRRVRKSPVSHAGAGARRVDKPIESVTATLKYFILKKISSLIVD